MALVLQPNLCLIFCRDPARAVTPARLAGLLRGAGLRVEGADFPLTARGDDSPAFSVTATRGEIVGDVARRLLGRRRKYWGDLLGCDLQVEIGFADLDEVLNQGLHELIEMQEALKDELRGVIYRSWNDTFSGPDG